jgi:hypothetical protein
MKNNIEIKKPKQNDDEKSINSKSTNVSNNSKQMEKKISIVGFMKNFFKKG